MIRLSSRKPPNSGGPTQVWPRPRRNFLGCRPSHRLGRGREDTPSWKYAGYVHVHTNLLLVRILRLLVAIASGAVIDSVAGVSAASRFSECVVIANNSHQRRQCEQWCRIFRPLRRAYVQNLETRKCLYCAKSSSSQGTRRNTPSSSCL